VFLLQSLFLVGLREDGKDMEIIEFVKSISWHKAEAETCRAWQMVRHLREVKCLKLVTDCSPISEVKVTAKLVTCSAEIFLEMC